MSPASIGAEIIACLRTIDLTLSAVIRVGAMLAFVRVLSPPNVGQSAGSAAAVTAAWPPRAAPRPPCAGARCWLIARETDAMIAAVKIQNRTGWFISFCLSTEVGV